MSIKNFIKRKKSNILLAILAIALVSSIIMTGTWAWLEDHNETGTSQNNEVATIKTKVETGDTTNLFLMIDDVTFKEEYVSNIPILGSGSAKYAVLLPGDGIATQNKITLENNREAVLRINYNVGVNIPAGLVGKVITELDINDALSNIKVGNSDVSMYKSKTEGVYYVYIPANGTVQTSLFTITTKIGLSQSVTVGGLTFKVNITPDVWALQATKNALGEVWSDELSDSGWVNWVNTLPIGGVPVAVAP